MLLPWVAFAFLVAVAAVMYVARRDLAQFQALILGGRLRPGCVVAEVIALLVLAVLVLLFGRAVL